MLKQNAWTQSRCLLQHSQAAINTGTLRQFLRYYAYPVLELPCPTNIWCVYILLDCTTTTPRKSYTYMALLNNTYDFHETMTVTLMTTLAACRRPPVPQRFHGMPGQRSSEGQYRTEQPPADIADSILSNPWTAALMQGDADRPQLYANSLALTRIGIGSWAPEPAHAQAGPKLSSQGHHQPQPTPDTDVTADFSSSETDTASLHSSHGEDELRLDAEADRQATDSCSSGREDGAGSAGDDMHSGDSRDHRQGRSDSTGQQQDRVKPADPVLHSKPNVAAGSQHADASTSSSERDSSDRADSPALQSEPDAASGGLSADALPSSADQGSSDGATLSPERDSSNKGRSDKGNSDRGSSPTASDASAARAQPARYIDRAVAFTNRHGEQTRGLQQNSAAPNSEESNVKGGRRGFASWIGDFGHLEGPRFNKQQGRAWQAHMRSQRDQPPESCSNPHSVPEVGKHIS